MKRTLSSQQTVLMKFVFPAVWIPLFGSGTLSMFLGAFEGPDPPPRWIFLFAWVAGVGFIWWSCVRLKQVSVDDNLLYVSNYIKEIAIPLSEIYDVTENRWLNIHPVTIRLKSSSEFGDKIVFMPTVRFFALFGSHPVVSELKELARSKSMASGSIRWYH
jgi:hypothetical protein